MHIIITCSIYKDDICLYAYIMCMFDPLPENYTRARQSSVCMPDMLQLLLIGLYTVRQTVDFVKDVGFLRTL
jgi:hypothetical protein